MGIASDPDVTISEAIYASCPTLLYMFAGWKCHDEDHRRIERRQAEGHTWAYAHTPSQRTPTCALTLILSIHWYVQLSTGIFSELQTSEVCKFRQPYFPILKFSCVFVQHRSSPALYLIFLFFPLFFISLVSLLSAPCFTNPRSFIIFFGSQHWMNLNFSQPSVSVLLLASAQHNWHHLNLCKVLQPVIERKIEKKREKW